ncbi:AfsR/SARP family transcriptional regulator [Streptomyces diastatochromogenes]|nr:AfsR/SARP family transcriptional regulator [Streptomyces diastatochromogenes]
MSCGASAPRPAPSPSCTPTPPGCAPRSTGPPGWNGWAAATACRPPGTAVLRSPPVRGTRRPRRHTAAGGRRATAAAVLRSALDLWQGEALADTTEHLAQEERPWLEEARLTALEDRAEAELATGLPHGLLAELTGLVARYPLRERFRCLLMTAQCRAGQPAAALLQFHSGRELLADRLGVDPGPLLTRTFQQVLTGELAA